MPVAVAENGLILRARARTGVNALRSVQKHMLVHLAVAAGMTLFLLAGGTFFFHRVFAFLMATEVFGPPLMDRLVGIVLLAFFAMLVFSNLIITLSTSYISREVDFLMALPFPHTAIFKQKLLESIIYSSWAFAVLSLPFFLAFGISRGADIAFYPAAALLVLPFLAIPATLGAIVTMIVTAFLPARKTRLLVAVLFGVSLVMTLVLARVMGLGRMFSSAQDGNFMEIMSFLEIGSAPELPSSWMLQGMLAVAPADLSGADWGSYLFWLAMLVSTALFLMQVAVWMAPPLYYRGWLLSKDSVSSGDVRPSRWSPLAAVDRAMGFLPVQYRAILSKDLRTFWRDPAQWTQLVILGGLMLIYLVNLGYAQRYHRGVESLIREWNTLVALFNLGATCFILSILTTRFVYPMLSLEGRQFWAVGLAPMKRTAVVWQKYLLCVGSALGFSMVLLAVSNTVLDIEPAMARIAVAATVMMALGLSGLSIGIGALMPNFREDNPARIANGLGGTANAMLSLAYIGATIALLAVPVRLWFGGDWDEYAWWSTVRVPWIAFLLALQAVVIVLPLWFGLRRWKRLEF